MDLYNILLCSVRPLGLTGRLERKRKANTIDLTKITLSVPRNRGLSPIPSLWI